MKLRLVFLWLFFAVCGTLKAYVPFDYVAVIDGIRTYIRMPHGADSVCAVLYCHRNMTEEVLFRSDNFCRQMDRLGVAMAFIQDGSQNWDVTKGCQERFEKIMADFASGTGHPEIIAAPVIPFGHSAQATFPWNFAAWNPDRTLCIISFHGDAPRTNLCGYGRENIEWGRTRNIDGIPGLMIMGEYEWWEARLLPALAFRLMYPNSCISFLGDAGRGHFDMSERTADYIARFIEKSLQQRAGGKTLRKIDPTCGWLAQRWNPTQQQRALPAPFASYKGCRHDAFWYFDGEMAIWAERRYAETLNKQSCWLHFVNADGSLMDYHPDRHCKVSARLVPDEDDTFTVRAVFTDSLHKSSLSVRDRSIIKVKLMCGPATAVNDSTFRIDRSHPTWNEPKRRAKITLCAEAPGDDVFKEAVQEIEVTVGERL